VLDEALETASPVEIQELTPLHTARAEAAWLDGDLARAGKEALIGLELGRRASDSVAAWWWGEAAFWAWQAGAIRRLPSGTPAPYRLHAAGRHRDAAAAWAEIGAPYAEALALAESADERDLRRGLSILQRLGADPAARRVVAALQRLGAVHVPRGPRQSTRRNPAGLTAREMEVLELLGRHMRNAEIAEHLVLSPKTVDHHVSAILHKLSVANRASAVEAAALLNLKDGDRASPG